MKSIDVALKEKYPRYSPKIGSYSAMRICAFIGREVGIREVIAWLKSDHANGQDSPSSWESNNHRGSDYARELERRFCLHEERK